MKAAIYARKSAVLLLVVLIAYGCSKPFTPLSTAIIECSKVTGEGTKWLDSFERCMHDKGWVSKGNGEYEQVR